MEAEPERVMVREERHVDRTHWRPGPWQDEPDLIEWRFRGVRCLMMRSPARSGWCGYAAVPPSHPWHELHYDDVPVEAHGGLTFSGRFEGCGVDGEWWIGFDCGHAWDVQPESTYQAALREITAGGRALTSEQRQALSELERLELHPARLPGEEYRDVAFVQAEVEGMALEILRTAWGLADA